MRSASVCATCFAAALSANGASTRSRSRTTFSRVVACGGSGYALYGCCLGVRGLWEDARAAPLPVCCGYGLRGSRAAPLYMSGAAPCGLTLRRAASVASGRVAMRPVPRRSARYVLPRPSLQCSAVHAHAVRWCWMDRAIVLSHSARERGRSALGVDACLHPRVAGVVVHHLEGDVLICKEEFEQVLLRD